MKRTDYEVKAFPFAAEYGHPAGCGGMTLRDYFAGQVLIGKQWGHDGFINCADLARECYMIAEAMMSVRELEDPSKKPEETTP